MFPGVKIAMSMIVTETSVQFLECPKCEAVLDYEEEDVIIRWYVQRQHDLDCCR